MSVDSILSMHPSNMAPLVVLVMAMVFIIGAILVSYLANSLAQTMACTAFVAMACFGAGWMAIAHDHGRVSQAREEVVDGFDQAYGLQLDDRDVDALKQVEKNDVARNLETSGGLLKQVLFRVVGDQVLPYTMDSEGTWTPLPAQQITGEAHTVAPYSKESNER